MNTSKSVCKSGPFPGTDGTITNWRFLPVVAGVFGAMIGGPVGGVVIFILVLLYVELFKLKSIRSNSLRNAPSAIKRIEERIYIDETLQGKSRVDALSKLSRVCTVEAELHTKLYEPVGNRWILEFKIGSHAITAFFFDNCNGAEIENLAEPKIDNSGKELPGSKVRLVGEIYFNGEKFGGEYFSALTNPIMVRCCLI